MIWYKFFNHNNDNDYCRLWQQGPQGHPEKEIDPSRVTFILKFKKANDYISEKAQVTPGVCVYI